MNKKDLKMYVSPVLEVVELEANAVLLAGSNTDNPLDDSTSPTPGVE